MRRTNTTTTRIWEINSRWSSPLELLTLASALRRLSLLLQLQFPLKFPLAAVAPSLHVPIRMVCHYRHLVARVLDRVLVALVLSPVWDALGRPFAVVQIVSVTPPKGAPCAATVALTPGMFVSLSPPTPFHLHSVSRERSLLIALSAWVYPVLVTLCHPVNRQYRRSTIFVRDSGSHSTSLVPNLALFLPLLLPPLSVPPFPPP
ncbi:hypothetical protein F5B17DRAFT_382059 [Nemania serpens]|nr:hypothetical protein F5B17DRAFT_382059 [Nemania serpens]